MVERKPTTTTDRGDDAFAGRFREAWGRPAMNPIQAAEFDARLEARRHGRERPLRLLPAFVGAAVVAVLVSAVWIGRADRRDDDDFLASLAEAEAVAVAAVDVAADDGDGDDVAWADLGVEDWPGVDEDAQGDLSRHLSGEYQVLAAWMFPADQDVGDETDE